MADVSLVMVNGPVFTSDPVRPWARAVAVSGREIVAVGTEAECLDVVGTGTRVVDLAGRAVLPGFQDAHVHPIHGGLAASRCDLLAVDGRSAALDAIADYASAHAGPWILGRGWAYEWFEGGYPTAALLDRHSGDRPAYLVVRDGHSGWANSKALALAGVTADTADPPGGRIERCPDGSPQGTLHEEAMELVERVLPEESEADLDRALEAGRSYLFSVGVTGWHDAWVTPEYHRAYRRAAASGTLGAPVRGAVWWDRTRGIEQVADVIEMTREGLGSYDPGAVKLMLDGVCESFTASMLEPYDGAEGSGVDFIDPADLERIVTRLDAAGLQCHFHAIGDAAVRWALDAVEAARLANGWNDLRHTIAHVQVVSPADVPRFHRLGVVANCQPLWACNDRAMTELTVPFLGPDRWRHQYPFGSLARSGAVLAMGSDWPVSTADVMDQVSVAVRRLPPGDDRPAVFLPEQRLGLGEALVAFTAGSAFVDHQAGARGLLRPGNVADLVVLDADPFTVADPNAVKVSLTVAAGDIVYERDRS